ncbi:MAG TPA: hypothetical protein VGS19_21565 [Streptosporangiaceae bacterium]|nr:hypothetical protein [Streptosporangiaceae bacterium]
MHGGRWQFWVMGRAVGSPLWYAQLLAEPKSILERGSAAELSKAVLSKAVTEWEKTVDDARGH